MIRELSELYSASVRGAAPHLPELPIQYADYAAWQLEHLGSREIEEQLGYWRHQLAGCQPLDLPTDHPRPPVRTYRGSAVNFSVPDDLMDAVRQISRASGVTPFVALLAAYAAVLARWSGQDDIVIGSAAANRARAETVDLIGLFMNTLALRVPVDPSASFAELLDVVKQTVLGAFANQDAPFDRIVEALNPARDLSRAAIYQTMFVFNNMPIPSAELEGLTAEPVAVERDAVESELSMTLNQTAAGTTGVLEFSTDLFDLASAAAVRRPLAGLPERGRALAVDAGGAHRRARARGAVHARATGGTAPMWRSIVPHGCTSCSSGRPRRRRTRWPFAWAASR